jgi:hypothetical protein
MRTNDIPRHERSGKTDSRSDRHGTLIRLVGLGRTSCYRREDQNAFQSFPEDKHTNIQCRGRQIRIGQKEIRMYGSKT